MTHTHITRYRHGDGPEHVELLDYDYETGDVTRRALDASDRVDDVDEDYELVGLAENYADPATVWAIYEHIHSDAWAFVTVAEELEPDELTRELYAEESDV